MTIIDAKTGAAEPYVFDADERSFRAAVIERSRETPVVVDFWAPWCGPCRVLGPILEKLAAEAKGAWVLAKVNVDNNPRLAQMFGIQGIPAVKALSGGQVVDEFTGALPESQVRAWLKRLAAPPVSPAEQLVQHAAEIEQTDPPAADAAYRQALQTEPGNQQALFGLGRLLLMAGDPEGGEALAQIPAGTPLYARAQAMLPLGALVAEVEGSPAALLDRLEQSPGDLEARLGLAAHHVAARRYEDAVDELLAIVMRSRAFRDDIARAALLALFAALGDAHPLVADGRRRLANLLF